MYSSRTLGLLYQPNCIIVGLQLLQLSSKQRFEDQAMRKHLAALGLGYATIKAIPIAHLLS